jgi:hypothetical protein
MATNREHFRAWRASPAAHPTATGEKRSGSTITADERRAVTRAWPIEMVIHAAFEGRGLPAEVRFELSLRRIEAYVRAAQAQAARLDTPVAAYLKELAAEPPSIVHWPSAQLAADAHFYFICWDSVAKELESLRRNPAELSTPRKVWRKYRKSLESYQRARGHLEHYSERLPMGKHSDWTHELNDTGETVRGDPGAVRLGALFTLNGEEWDVSLKGAKVLESMLQDLIEGLRDETEARFAAWLSGEPFSRRK